MNERGGWGVSEAFELYNYMDNVIMDLVIRDQK